jgi:hypothetical protein
MKTLTHLIGLNPPQSPFEKGEAVNPPQSPFEKGEALNPPFLKGETLKPPFLKGGRGDLTTALLITLCSCLQIPNTALANDWTYSVTPQAFYGDYGKSQQRNSSYGTGFFASVDYLDKAGLTVGYNYSYVDFKDGLKDISQHGMFASQKFHFSPDSLPGRLTLRLDGHYLTNDDATNSSDNVIVFAPQLAFLNHAKDLYLDVGYARSFYGNDLITGQKLAVNQWTATVGLGFNDGYDWLQLRSYVVDPTNKTRAQGKGETFAGNVKATHYFMPNDYFMHSIYVDGLFGERIFAVDHDAAAVYNLADVQKGSVSLGAKWMFSLDLTALVVVGYDRYKNQTINDNYDNRYVYLNLTKSW